MYAPLALGVYSCRHLFPEEAIHNCYRSSHPETFLVKGVLKICSKFTENTHADVWFQIRHGCSPVNFLHIFRTPFSRNTFGWLRLLLQKISLGVLKVQIVATINFRQKQWKITVTSIKILIIVINKNVTVFFCLHPTSYLKIISQVFSRTFGKIFRRLLIQNNSAANGYFEV